VWFVSLFAAHVDNEMYLSRSLERLGGNALSKDQEPDIGAAFLKFAVVTKELSALMKTLVSTAFLLSETPSRLCALYIYIYMVLGQQGAS
jgi:hypothetical protein